MKKYILIFAATLFFITSYAQYGGYPNSESGKLPDDFLQSLNINEKQKKDLQTAFANYQKKVTELRERADNEKLDRADIQKKTLALKEQHLEGVKSLLGSAYKPYADYTLMDRRQQMEYILEMKLRLTAEQKKQYDAINASVNQVTSELRKKYQGDRAAMFEALKPVNEKKKQMMSQILTDEQMKIYEESTKSRGGHHH